MNDRPHRLNQSRLRPGLEAAREAARKANRTPQPNTQPNEPLPAGLVPSGLLPAVETAGAQPNVIDAPWAGPSRPVHVYNAPVLEDEGQAEYDPAQSSAPKWGMVLMLLIVLVWGAALLIGFQTSLAILMGAGLLLVVVGLLSPSLGLLAMGMLAALDAVANIFLLTGGLLRFNTINYWLVIVMALFIPFILRLRDINTRALQVFVVLLALEISFSKDMSRGIQDVLNIGVTFGMVVYFARALKDELALYWLGMVNGLLAGLGGLIFFLQMEKLPYANPNDWTYFHITALFSICIAYPFAVKYNKDRIFLLAMAAINFAWIFLSGSRGSLMVAALCGVYLFLATRSLTWKTVMIALAFLIGAWVTASFVEEQTYMISRIQMLFDPSISATKRTSKRSVIAEAGLRIFEKNPMGIGTGGFEQEALDTRLLGSSRPAHSAWIKVLAENGIPGIALMVVFISSYLLAGLRQPQGEAQDKPQEGRLLFALFITLVLATAFVAKEFRGKSLWFLAASGIALLRPQEMSRALASLQGKRRLQGKRDATDIDYRRRLREVRFGRKR